MLYTWHPWGELKQRKDVVGNVQWDDFFYDALHRLWRTKTRSNIYRTTDVQYDNLGNIINKGDVGPYTYDASGRLDSYGSGSGFKSVDHDANGNITNRGSDTFTYTPFDKIRQLTSGSSSYLMTYDADGQRVRRTRVGYNTTVTSTGGLYERSVANGALEDTVLQIVAGGHVVGLVRHDGTPQGERVAVHDDHLGSGTFLTNEAGAMDFGVHYDPWGKAKSWSNWNNSVSNPTAGSVGFTGHPARLDTQLIDMGGRSYDPHVARFWSTDPIVSDPLNGQAWNAYSYVHNRPMIFTDPSGYNLGFYRRDGSWWELGQGIRQVWDNSGTPGGIGIGAGQLMSPGDLDRLVSGVSSMNGFGSGGPPTTVSYHGMGLSRGSSPVGNGTGRGISISTFHFKIAGDRDHATCANSGGTTGAACSLSLLIPDETPGGERERARQQTAAEVDSDVRNGAYYKMAEDYAMGVVYGIMAADLLLIAAAEAGVSIASIRVWRAAGGTLRPMARSLGAAGDDLLLKKAVNSNLPHAIAQRVERGIFANREAAGAALRGPTQQINKMGTFPTGTLVDTARPGRFLVPVGDNGLAVYRLAKNGTAKLKTVLIAR